MTELMRAWDFGAAGFDWLSLKYSLRLRGGKVLLSRSAISSESLSGEDERSGDSGEDRGGVSASASSMQRTRFDGLRKCVKLVSKFKTLKDKNLLIITWWLHVASIVASIRPGVVGILHGGSRRRWFQSNQVVGVIA